MGKWTSSSALSHLRGSGHHHIGADINYPEGYLERYGVPLSPADLEINHKIVGYFSAATGEVWPLRFRNRGKEKQIVRFDIAPDSLSPSWTT
ncbi:hypothetical protein Q4520_08925 [Alteromonas sp. 1_MG-2023]|uniref:hypothetical protein n=1 Tax=Alteromonas sp. 1_MG-2023 TaxID=3062669 RepID=UPI0026E2C3B2|nr:hypothetical protein [Alteromonas sp. 1_MG-2023]MDO6475544.1 hypothetical protein [Alteromonas sp. 1_MG-2023]